MSDAVSDRAGEKRRRILDAARFLMLRNGLRGTTMESIAREAEIAKATLYAQFADKEAIFAGIADSLMDELLDAYDAGLAQPGDLAERVGAALAGQYARLAQLLGDSPHAAELMSEHKRIGLKFREKDLRAESEIAALLGSAGIAEPDMVSRVIIHAAYGIALKTRDESEMVAAIKLLCRRMIGPVSE